MATLRMCDRTGTHQWRICYVTMVSRQVLRDTGSAQGRKYSGGRMHIAVYAFDDITMFHLSIPQMVFDTVSRLGLANWQVSLFTTTSESVTPHRRPRLPRKVRTHRHPPRHHTPPPSAPQRATSLAVWEVRSWRTRPTSS